VTTGVIAGINGPILTVEGTDEFIMSEMVFVSDRRLVGEIIGITGPATVQVFEDTSGLRPGEKVYGTGRPLSVTLGPGIIGNIFDGIQRPLKAIEAESGIFIPSGVHSESLSDKKWPMRMLKREGAVTGGEMIAETQEAAVLHKIMVPPGISGEIEYAAEDGAYSVNDVIMRVAGQEITLCHKWPVRRSRPVARREPISRPLITGQRVIDTLFPIAQGGAAALPGGFGTGKTMLQHQLAKWSDADVIIYIGCGERGNEITQVLEEFSKLIDPHTGRPLMERTVMIANTSNMPVAAREASIYTGVTLAEYYRDMGYHVAVMADSSSRWAEALRELSGRLEEMPAEEGFPAYLASRLSQFYERAGAVKNLNETEGSITLIGAVSPAGGDFSEPVTQNTKRFTRCFWALDRSLAYSRHFPAVHWLTSYSEYLDDLSGWFSENVGEEFINHRKEILRIMQEESELMEIVRLVGVDVLPESQKLVLEIAKTIRLGFIQQNAFHAFDTFTPFDKQMKMMEIILYLNEKCKKLVGMSIPMRLLVADGIFDKIIAIKYNVPNDKLELLDRYYKEIDGFYDRVYMNNL